MKTEEEIKKMLDGVHKAVAARDPPVEDDYDLGYICALKSVLGAK